MTEQTRTIANLVLTLDGRVCGPAGPNDMSCIAPYAVSDVARANLVRMTEASVALLGRVNYQGFGSWWPAVARDESADPRDRAFARWLDGVEKVVFTSTLDTLDWQNSRRAEGGPAEEVRRLRASATGDIRILSSVSIIRQLLAADELDRLELTLAPEVIGGGPRLFDDGVLPASRWQASSAVVSPVGATHLSLDRVRW